VSLLQLDSISKAFGAVRALRGVSLDLQAGEVHALLGENGAGKSTLIRVVSGAHQPDEGTISVAGQTVRHLTPAAAHRHGIACIYQQPALFADLTVAENIALRLEAVSAWRRVDWPARYRRASDLLSRIGGALHSDAEVRLLSMPEQQLVEIACVIGAGARIVIMDEPTSSLTRREQERLFEVVRKLRSQGAGVIYISHRLEEIFELADRVTVLRDGATVGTRRLREGSAVGKIGQRQTAADQTDEPPPTESELIRMMVGREVSHIYPPADGITPGEVVLSLRGIGCARSGIRDVSLDLRAGEVVALAGLVGAGRTELARVLFGMTPADAGEIRMNGRRVEIRTPRKAVELGIGYLPEDRRRHGIILEMPIAHNISMAVHRQLFRGGWLRFHRERELALEYMQELAIRAPGTAAPGASLSGGNQQKVALARWLATRPRVLILDEPTQGVDVGAKGEIHRIIRRFSRHGMAVLMISSDLPEVLGMGDRIAVMRGGTLVATFPGGASAHEVMAAAVGGGGPA
jgi:rhamnose transport system ATP-binding protein